MNLIDRRKNVFEIIKSEQNCRSYDVYAFKKNYFLILKLLKILTDFNISKVYSMFLSEINTVAAFVFLISQRRKSKILTIGLPRHWYVANWCSTPFI